MNQKALESLDDILEAFYEVVEDPNFGDIQEDGVIGTHLVI